MAFNEYCSAFASSPDMLLSSGVWFLPQLFAMFAPCQARMAAHPAFRCKSIS